MPFGSYCDRAGRLRPRGVLHDTLADPLVGVSSGSRESRARRGLWVVNPASFGPRLRAWFGIELPPGALEPYVVLLLIGIAVGI